MGNNSIFKKKYSYYYHNLLVCYFVSYCHKSVMSICVNIIIGVYSYSNFKEAETTLRLMLFYAKLYL